MCRVHKETDQSIPMVKTRTWYCYFIKRQFVMINSDCLYVCLSRFMWQVFSCDKKNHIWVNKQKHLIKICIVSWNVLKLCCSASITYRLYKAWASLSAHFSVFSFQCLKLTSRVVICIANALYRFKNADCCIFSCATNAHVIVSSCTRGVLSLSRPF